jgi:stage II sporulation protein R
MEGNMDQLFSSIHKHNNSKNSKCSILISAFTILLLLLYAVNAKPVTSAKAIQKGIASEIIRFHVIANSDSKEDQELKLKVKEEVVNYLRPILENAPNNKEARKIMIHQEPQIKRIAERVIGENGYSYPVKVSLGNSYFPTKVYGDLTFPPGVYEALKIEIGKAEGRNWWCVMFPPLCFVDATYSVVPEKSKGTLKHVLTDEEYDAVISKRETIYTILTGIALDEAAEKKILDEKVNTLISNDNGLYGLDEILALSIVNMNGSIALTNFGYLDKLKPGIIGVIDKEGKMGIKCHTFLDDIVCAIAASAASRLAHSKEE